VELGPWPRCRPRCPPAALRSCRSPAAPHQPVLRGLGCYTACHSRTTLVTLPVKTASNWAPLGMTTTRFGPLPPHVAARCAPTELDDQTGVHLKGIAHDFSARLLGGGCGIAGAFSTLADTEKFLRYLLDPTMRPHGPSRSSGHRGRRSRAELSDLSRADRNLGGAVRCRTGRVAPGSSGSGVEAVQPVIRSVAASIARNSRGRRRHR